MKIFLKILKIVGIIVLVLGLLFAALYYFGSLKLFEPNSVVVSDGAKIEFTIQDGWCGVDASLLGIKDLPANSLFIKRGGCKVQDLNKGIKLAELVQVRANLLADAFEERGIIELCVQSAYGLSGYKKDGAIYCLGTPKNGARGINSFKEVDGKYIVTTSFFLLDDLDRTQQLKNLEGLVNSYRVKK